MRISMSSKARRMARLASTWAKGWPVARTLASRRARSLSRRARQWARMPWPTRPPASEAHQGREEKQWQALRILPCLTPTPCMRHTSTTHQWVCCHSGVYALLAQLFCAHWRDSHRNNPQTMHACTGHCLFPRHAHESDTSLHAPLHTCSKLTPLPLHPVPTLCNVLRTCTLCR